MRLRSTARKCLEKVDYGISRFLGYTYWLHVGDLLTPCEGEMTSGQYIVASRVLDIDRIRGGGAPFWEGGS